MIIDSHGHLGDILYPGGAELIFRTGVKKERIWDPQDLNEKMLNRSLGMGLVSYKVLDYWVTKAQRARNATATLENFTKSLDESGVTQAVCLPIAPYVTFDDLLKAKEKEDRIIPFTSVDFTREYNVSEQLRRDVEKGAAGLKLHPIIQKVRLTDKRTMSVLEAFQPWGKPVLLHAGRSRYYLGKEKVLNEPRYGEIRDVEEVVRTFSLIKFIIGHAGLFWMKEVCRRLKGLDNVWVDTSFQSPEEVRFLITTFGPERVLYASDWPWGNRLPHIEVIKVAVKGDKKLEELILWKNAYELILANNHN